MLDNHILLEFCFNHIFYWSFMLDNHIFIICEIHEITTENTKLFNFNA